MIDESLKVLVTGKNGQLGSELQIISKLYPEINFLFTDISELDISNEEMVADYFSKHSPSVVINAAAYTAVDKAETEREKAMHINADAVGNLAAQCSKVKAQFIHISTDYVFDGEGKAPYTEDHPVNPVNYYGLTKLKGEEQAFKHCENTIIIRTSWVYSSFGKNFVKTMMKLMLEKESINVVNDQFGSPTYAADLAKAILQIVTSKHKMPGIYHYSNNGIISWYDFAKQIKSIIGSNCKINAVDTAGYPTPAKRPHYSALNKEKIVSAFSIQTKDWETSLKNCIELMYS